MSADHDKLLNFGKNPEKKKHISHKHLESAHDAEKIRWKGDTETFFVIAGAGMAEKWRKDKTIPIVDALQSFTVWRENGGDPMKPSVGELNSFFGTSKEDDAAAFILQNGEIIHSHFEKKATRNMETADIHS